MSNRFITSVEAKKKNIWKNMSVVFVEVLNVHFELNVTSFVCSEWNVSVYRQDCGGFKRQLYAAVQMMDTSEAKDWSDQRWYVINAF